MVHCEVAATDLGSTPITWLIRLFSTTQDLSLLSRRSRFTFIWPDGLSVSAQGLSEQQKLIITVISVVSVLVANVSFLGYVTPPGGPHPWWETCSEHYHTFVAFLVLNGLAFLFSLGAMGVVVVLPWLYPERDASRHKGSINRWISWGLGLLFSAILFFTVAFVAAGLVTGGFNTPPLQCGVLPCARGGMPCVPSTQSSIDVFRSLQSLNNMSGDCFAVSGIATGTTLLQNLPAGSTPVQYKGGLPFLSIREAKNEAAFSQGFLKQACYLNITSINATDPGFYIGNTKDILCTAGLVPTRDSLGNPVPGTNPVAAGYLAYYEALANMTSPGNMWLADVHDANLFNWYFMIPGTDLSDTWCPTNQSGCACSPNMVKAWNDGTLMFVTYAPPGRPKGVYAASIADASTNPPIDDYTPWYHLNTSSIETSLGRKMNLYAPHLFYRQNVAVYDESHIRCIQSSNKYIGKPTLCMLNSTSRDDSPKFYSKSKTSSSVFERHCGWNASSQWDCTGLAVNTDGSLIMMSQLADFGYEVLYDPEWVGGLGQQTGKFAFSILGTALGLYACILVAVCCCRFGWWRRLTTILHGLHSYIVMITK